MKVGMSTGFLEDAGRVFGIHIGEGMAAEHRRWPASLASRMGIFEPHPGAICVRREGIRENLRFESLVARGEPVAALGQDRFDQYRNPETWLKAQLKFVRPRCGSGSLVGAWNDDDFIVFAHGAELVEEMRCLADAFLAGDLCISWRVNGPDRWMHHPDEQRRGLIFSGLCLSAIELAPMAWLAQLEDTKQFLSDRDKWPKRLEAHGSVR